MKNLLLVITFMICASTGFAKLQITRDQGSDKPAIPPNPTQLYCMQDCQYTQRGIGQPESSCLYIPAMNQVRDLRGNVWSCTYGPNIPDPYQNDDGGSSSGDCQDPYQSGCP